MWILGGHNLAPNSLPLVSKDMIGKGRVTVSIHCLHWGSSPRIPLGFFSSLPTSKSHTRESRAEDPPARRVEWSCLSKPSFHSLLVALEPWQSCPRPAQGSRMLTCGCVVGPGYPHSVPGGSHSPPFCVAGLF